MSSDDRDAIEQTVQTYFDGLYEGDADKLASVLAETSALTYEQDGKLTVLTREQWLKWVRERPKPKDKGLARDDVILLIDQAGPGARSVSRRVPAATPSVLHNSVPCSRSIPANQSRPPAMTGSEATG